MRAKGRLVVPRKSRKKLTPEEKKLAALKRAQDKLSVGHQDGKLVCKKMREEWDQMETGKGKKDQLKGDGMILSLIQLNLSALEIQAVVGCGGGRIDRLRNRPVSIRKKLKPKHACSAEDYQRITNHIQSYQLEDGFACAHRRQLKYFTEQGLTWTSVYKSYKKLQLEHVPKFRALSYTRWIEIVHWMHPALRLTRVKEDVCDACVRLEIELARVDLTAEERAAFLKEKNLHLKAAITQRRGWTDKVEACVKKADPNLKLPNFAFPDHVDDPLIGSSDDEGPEADSLDEKKQDAGRAQLLCEDFGGSIPIPSFKSAKPSADYFNSNLICHNFVITDITRGKNNVMFYDERYQGKGADAVCSMRLRFHLEQYKRFKEEGIPQPVISFSLLDNCTGQNKSNVVMKFNCLLSLLFYKHVDLIFLIPGHSHMHPDRVTGWCRRSCAGRNLYTPDAIATRCNTVKGISAEVLKPDDDCKPFRVGFQDFLNKHFVDMPAGFTQHYFFEFTNGWVFYRHLLDTREEDVVKMKICNDTESFRKMLVKELFGVSNLQEAEFKRLSLPVHKGNKLSRSKIVSLGKKYFAIPVQFRSYFPDVSELKVDDDEVANEPEVLKPKKGRENKRLPLVLKLLRRREKDLVVQRNFKPLFQPVSLCTDFL